MCVCTPQSPILRNVCVMLIILRAVPCRVVMYFLQQSGRMPLRYCILLIITDGISQEIEETKRKLAVYSSVPLSVIFVGIGRAEFKSMYNLCDGEQEEEQQRKNTTFVEFRHHQHDPASMGRAALSEMPNQIVEYMTQNGIQPSHLA